MVTNSSYNEIEKMNNRGIERRLPYPPAKSEPVVFFLFSARLIPLYSYSSTTSTTTSIKAPMEDDKVAPVSTFPTTCAALLSSAFCHLPLSTSPRPPRPVFTSPICSYVTTLHASLLAASQRLVEALGKSPFSFILRPRCYFAQNQLLEFKRPNSLSMHNFAAILPGDSVAGIVVASGISNFLNLYNTLLVIRLVLTWFPNSPPAIVSPLSTICDPYLNIFRGLIPPLGGTLDLSPILAFLVLNAFTSTAAALPAEHPTSGSSPTFLNSSGSAIQNLTCTQTKWMQRISRSRPAKPEK